MKKILTIALGLAFLLLWAMPAMAETVSGPGYAAGSVGSYSYDPYTGQANVQWSTAYGVNPYGDPATTTTTATETRNGTGVRIDSSNQTANGRSYSAGGSTDASSYSDDCREEVTEEVNTASSSVDVCGTSDFFLEAATGNALGFFLNVSKASAQTLVGFEEALGKIGILHVASNSEGSHVQLSFMATEVNDYLGGGYADASVAKAGQYISFSRNVTMAISAGNAAGFSASVSIEADMLVDADMGFYALADSLHGGQSFGAGTNVTAFSKTQNATGEMASLSIEAARLADFGQGADASEDLAHSGLSFDAGTNVAVVGEAQNAVGYKASLSIEAAQFSDFGFGVRAWADGVKTGLGAGSGINVAGVSQAQTAGGEQASTSFEADQLTDFGQWAGVRAWNGYVQTGVEFDAGENVTAVTQAQNAQGDSDSASATTGNYSDFIQWADAWPDNVYVGQDWN